MQTHAQNIRYTQSQKLYSERTSKGYPIQCVDDDTLYQSKTDLR